MGNTDCVLCSDYTESCDILVYVLPLFPNDMADCGMLVQIIIWCIWRTCNDVVFN
ncbi:hypothetical protein HanIR_Chr06g0276961 [Helianthus annuus]|nr:hypothetical protein HanIR_Chr06g0276961 [Helianthus annuus]